MKSKFIKKKKFLILLILFTLGISCTVCFKRIYIDGISMEPTLANSEKVIMRKKFLNEKSSRYDIVFIKDPYDSGAMIVKRIVGLPGESIYCENGKIFINDKVIENSLELDDKTENFGPVTLEDNQYYVLGDNRDHSTDSRVFGSISENSIVGYYMD